MILSAYGDLALLYPRARQQKQSDGRPLTRLVYRTLRYVQVPSNAQPLRTIRDLASQRIAAARVCVGRQECQ